MNHHKLTAQLFVAVVFTVVVAITDPGFRHTRLLIVAPEVAKRAVFLVTGASHTRVFVLASVTVLNSVAHLMPCEQQ